VRKLEMLVELRKKAQITIPKEIVEMLNLHEGDHLEINVKDGLIYLEPVAVYKKSYVNKLEETIMMIQENPGKYTAGPFSSVEELKQYLEKDEEVKKPKKTYSKK
jgi:AbrB family looped-hinge helix DNA binding protein